MPTDQVYPYNLPEKTPVTINTRTDCAGILEFQAVKGTVFLVKGPMTKEEWEAALNSKPIPTWDLATMINGSPSEMFWDGNESSFTLFANELATGYVRILEL